jgi:CHAT domain-containing protein
LPPRSELESAVQDVLSRLLSPAAEAPPAVAAARQLLPDGALGDGPYRSLIIVPAGLLYYLPLELLPSGSGPLLEQYQTAYLPSASVLVELRSKPEQRGRPRLLALGDPVYGGPEARERAGALLSLQSLGALPHTRSEVNAVRSLFGRWSSTVMLGPDATEEKLKSLDLRRYSVVHLAAHGVIDASAPSRSGLVLGRNLDSREDGILQVREMFRLSLNASLVTLSACQSALGKLTTGEGMVGLTRALLYAGTDTVLASLWNVNDEATARFMQVFYRFLRDGRGKAEALRLAKLAVQEDARLRHPYYWAGYVLIGEGSAGVRFPFYWFPFGLVLVSLAVMGLWIFRKTRRRTVDSSSQSDSPDPRRISASGRV